PAVGTQHAGIQGLARLAGDAGHVVGQQVAQVVRGAFAGDVDVEHVGHVEHAGGAAYRMVFFELRTVGQGHVPASEIDDLGTQGDVGRSEEHTSEIQSREKIVCR